MVGHSEMDRRASPGIPGFGRFPVETPNPLGAARGRPPHRRCLDIPPERVGAFAAAGKSEIVGAEIG